MGIAELTDQEGQTIAKNEERNLPPSIERLFFALRGSADTRAFALGEFS